jgi:hypothetical protein
LSVLALIVPPPEKVSEAPVPTTIAALVFVPEVIEGNVAAPALMLLHPKPVPEVHVSALVTPEQEGTARPDGVVAVSAPRTVLAESEVSAV